MIFTSSEEEDNDKPDRDDEFKPESESEHDDDDDLELEKEPLEESDYENVSSDEVLFLKSWMLLFIADLSVFLIGCAVTLWYGLGLCMPTFWTIAGDGSLRRARGGDGDGDCGRGDSDGGGDGDGDTNTTSTTPYNY